MSGRKQHPHKLFLGMSGHLLPCPDNGNIIKDAAWYYPESSKQAGLINDHNVFWGGVKIESSISLKEFLLYNNIHSG
jgi:uncharacterized protein (DUF427 family)